MKFNFNFFYYRIWKDIALNDSLTQVEKAQLAVWDYPVSDKYTKVLVYHLSLRYYYIIFHKS